MTDNEKQGIKALVEETRDHCKALVDIMSEMESKYGIEICAISPQEYIMLTIGNRLVSIPCKATRIQCYKGCEKVFEATGCTGQIAKDRMPAGDKYIKALYDGDTDIFQISNNGIFEKAARRDNQYTREAAYED